MIASGVDTLVTPWFQAIDTPIGLPNMIGSTSADERRMSEIAVGRFEGAAAEWDGFVRGQPHWSHFHLFGWKTIMERVFRHECIYLEARLGKSGALIGVLPLVRIRSVVFGHFLVSMPFLNYGGPLGTPEAVRALADAAGKLAREKGVDLLEMRSRVELPIDLTASHRKITVVLDLPETPEALWSALPSKLRSQVRRPKKEGVEVRIGRDQLDPFFRVFAQHMRDLGTPTQGRAFFAAIEETFPDDVRFAVAYHQNSPIACGCGFFWNREFEITWASALRSHNAMSPNMLVYWELMEHAVKAGANLFNFGRCTRDSGTHKFKMQWGSREQDLWWYQVSKAGPEVAAATPSPDQGLFAVATRVWQRLPLSVATTLGPRVIRFIP